MALNRHRVTFTTHFFQARRERRPASAWGTPDLPAFKSLLKMDADCTGMRIVCRSSISIWIKKLYFSVGISAEIEAVQWARPKKMAPPALALLMKS